MSRFFSEKYKSLKPYTPGEQPKEKKYIKLNTNESPFPPSPLAVEAVAEAAKKLQLYPDPDCRALTEKLASSYGIDRSEIVWTNGSDDVLNFAFMAFCDQKKKAIFPDITYGFYKVFAEALGVPYEQIPLQDDFTIRIEDYFDRHATIFIANPNAPTGIPLNISEIEEILKHNTDSVVIIDEAYVDFGGESCIPLIRKYDNLLVTQTFSKSRSMAGARLGFGVGNPELIADLNTLRYSTNPYNINAMTMAAGIGTLSDAAYTEKNCKVIAENRAFTMEALSALGFSMTDSKANFVFARHKTLGGELLYQELKERGVLVRHFSQKRISDYVRITVGSREEMEAFLKALSNILEEFL
ncbi:MAG: histidinol-phosphate transaminase [Clostridia bacterium]|nr:histidinol-phosphate transaminase [Clostridia bacterium]